MEGRPVDVYTADSTKAGAEKLAEINLLGMFPVKSVQGELQIDQQTGGLLKANIDYTVEVSTADTHQVVGTGQGHLEINISKIGQASVVSPALPSPTNPG
jgi:hypothetical protein